VSGYDEARCVLPVCPISRLEQPGIFVKTGKVLWGLKGNMNAGKIEVSSEDAQQS
jgi:hypothetical protein